jgi:hypothetical protein
MQLKIHQHGNFVIPSSNMAYYGHTNLMKEGGTLLLSKDLGSSIYKEGSGISKHNFENLQRKVSHLNLGGRGIQKKKGYINFKI